MRRLALPLALALTGCATADAPPPSAAPGPKGALPAPAHLSGTARRLISTRMERHGAAMSDLMWAALFLDYRSTAELAGEIADEPKLARPLSRDASELNAALPAGFFDLQDELATHARRLADEAAAEDPERLSTALGALTDTCLRCHATYLSEPPRRVD